MFKRVFRITLSLLLIMALLTASVSASSPSPRYNYIIAVLAGLDIQNGVAISEGGVDAGFLPTRVVVRLQRCDPEGWVNIAVWYGSDDGTGIASARGSHTLTRTGYAYRTQVIATVYDDNYNLLESEIMYSELDFY